MGGKKVNYAKALSSIERFLEELQKLAVNLPVTVKTTLSLDKFIANGLALIQKDREQLAAAEIDDDSFKRQIAELAGACGEILRQAKEIAAKDEGRYSPRFLPAGLPLQFATPTAEEVGSAKLGASQLVTALVAGKAQLKSLSIYGDVTIIGQQNIVLSGAPIPQKEDKIRVTKWQLPPRARVCPGRFVKRPSLFGQIREKFDLLKAKKDSWVLMSFSGLEGCGKTYLATYLIS